MTGHTVAPKGRRRGPYHYYVCPKKVEEEWRADCPNRNHRAEDLEERVREFALRLIEDPDTLREQIEQLVADRYRDQQAEGLITMVKLREKLDDLREEREGLEARLAMLADGEQRLRELEELPALVEEYLRDLPALMRPEIRVREYETVPEARTEDKRFGVYTLTPERIRTLPEEELAERRRAAEVERGARFRELYAMLGLRAAVRADGTLDITVGATGETTKGVMPWNGSSSPSTTSTRT